jgi:murein tripeptide amidase MpaA
MPAFRLLALILTAVALTPPLETPAAQEGGEVVSVAAADFASARLGRRGLDRLMEKDGRIYLVVSPGEMAALSVQGVDYAVETPRLFEAAGRGLSAAGGINGAYHSTLELETDLRTLERDHPGLATVQAIGETLEGRTILALKVSDSAPDDEREPAILVTGCHHAREWISVEVPFLFGKHLLENYELDEEVRGLVDASEIWIVPAANPDGLEYSIHVYRYWRKNRRANADGTFGVDINRNYGTAWGWDDVGSSGQPASDVFRGTGPFSEPETAAIRDLFMAHDFRAVVSYHSYSQVILSPWGFTTEAPPTHLELAAVAGAMAGLIAGVRGTEYRAGQASRLLYLTNGDTADWTYALAGAPSFTIELPPVDVDHGGFFNDEAAIAGIFAENLPALLYLTRYAIDHPLPVRPPIRLPRDRSGPVPAGARKPAARTGPGR